METLFRVPSRRRRPDPFSYFYSSYFLKNDQNHGGCPGSGLGHPESRHLGSIWTPENNQGQQLVYYYNTPLLRSYLLGFSRTVRAEEGGMTPAPECKRGRRVAPTPPDYVLEEIIKNSHYPRLS